MAVEDPSIAKTLLDWAGAIIGTLSMLLYGKHEYDLRQLQDAQKCKASVKAVEDHESRLRQAVSYADFHENEDRAMKMREELREGQRKIFEILEKHTSDTRTRFDTLVTEMHNRDLKFLGLINEKADKT